MEIEKLIDRCSPTLYRGRAAASILYPFGAKALAASEIRSHPSLPLKSPRHPQRSASSASASKSSAGDLGEGDDADAVDELPRLHSDLGSTSSVDQTNRVLSLLVPRGFGLGIEFGPGPNPQNPGLTLEDRRKWFKDLPWEDRLQKADGNGTLVFIENLDPLHTPLEIEDIIYSTFKKSCTAKVIQRATFQNPNYGEAYLIFKSREAADEVVSEIDKGCLQLPNGRILVCTKGLLKVPKSSIFGHLSIDKLKLQMREMSMAVSTSHCSQPNTIEYEMAMEWLLVQQKFVRASNALHKRQAGELKELTKRLNTK